MKTYKPLYTPAEVAELLSVNPMTVYRWLQTGRVKGVKLPNKMWGMPHAELMKIGLKRYGPGWSFIFTQWVEAHKIRVIHSTSQARKTA